MQIIKAGRKNTILAQVWRKKMNYTLCNECLTVEISDEGAQLLSIRGNGTEYLWQGDPAYWQERSPVLFPFVGRFTDGKYTYDGVEYEMTLHGFAKRMTFAAETASDTQVTFTLSDTPETLKNYPRRFLFQISYTLKKNTLGVLYRVENRDEKMMHFGLGGHPGFNVPLEEGLSFEDYAITFAHPCRPDRVLFSPAYQLDYARPLYPLKDGTKIPLHHDLFDDDAIVLENMADTISIRSDKGIRSVTVHIPQMPYVGFWHKIRTDAPYVCIEPWVTLPSRDGVVEEFADRYDLIRLAPGGVYENRWEITAE